MENRNGLLVAADATLATGTAEREAAARVSEGLPEGATLGADKNSDADAFIEGLQGARDRAARGDQRDDQQDRGDAQDRRGRKPAFAMRSANGCANASRRGCGWTKTVGGLAQVKVRGLAKARAAFVFALAAYNLVRLPKLPAPTGEVCPVA